MKNIENLKVLMDDQDFLTKAAFAKTEEAIAALLKEYNIHVSAEEIRNVFTPDITEDWDSELSEEMLANVTGGGRVWDWIKNKLNSLYENLCKRNKEDFDDITNMICRG